MQYIVESKCQYEKNVTFLADDEGLHDSAHRPGPAPSLPHPDRDNTLQARPYSTI